MPGLLTRSKRRLNPKGPIPGEVAPGGPMRRMSLEKLRKFSRTEWGLPASMLAAACWVALASLPARAAEAPVPILKTRLVSISLFKNGLGFVAREAEIRRGQSAARIEDLPVPALGTFWVYSPNNDASVNDLVAYRSEASESLEAISVAEMIEANVGQTVDLRLGEKETVRARILGVAPNRSPDPRSEGHTSELQSLRHLVCRLLV